MGINISQYLNVIPDQQTRRALQSIFAQVISDLNANKIAYENHTHTSAQYVAYTAGLFAIVTGGSADIKTTADIQYVNSSGVIKVKSAATIDISAVSGYTPVAQATAKQRYYKIMIKESDGSWAVLEGADHASAAVVPDTPTGYIAVGLVKVVNTTGSNFTFGTTALDTGSLTVTYTNVSEPKPVYTGKPGSDTATYTQGTASAFVQNLTT